MTEIRGWLRGNRVLLVVVLFLGWGTFHPHSLAGQSRGPNATSDVPVSEVSRNFGTLILGPRTPVNPPIVGYHGEVMVAADPESDGDLIACGFRSNERTGSAYEGYVYHSGDGGKTWREVLVDANTQWVSEESCAFGPGRQAYFAAGDSDTSAGEPHHEYGNLHLYRSNDGGRTWQTILLSMFLDWTSLAVDATHSRWRNTVYLFANTVVDGTKQSIDSTSSPAIAKILPPAWTAISKTPYLATFRQLPQLSLSIASGSFNASDSGARFPGRFPRGATVLSDGTVAATFAGDREIVDRKSGSKTRVYSVELGASRDGGKSLQKTVLYEGVDPQIPTALALSPATHEIYVVWTPEKPDRAETPFTIASSRDQGQSWKVTPMRLPPDSVVDMLPGSLSLASNKDGVIGLMWYGEKGTKVYFAVSYDGGASIDKVVQLTTDLAPSPAQTPQRADDRRIAVYPPTWNPSSKLPEPLAILTFGPTRSGVPFGNALAADRTGAFHPMWSEVANGPTNLWTRTMSFQLPGQRRAVPTIDALTEISDRVVSHITNVRFDHLENLITFDLTVTNKSGAPVGSPIVATIGSQNSTPELSANNADNGKVDSGAAWELQVSQGALGSEHDTEPRTLSFHLDRDSDDEAHYTTLELLVRIYGKAQ